MAESVLSKLTDSELNAKTPAGEILLNFFFHIRNVIFLKNLFSSIKEKEAVGKKEKDNPEIVKKINFW